MLLASLVLVTGASTALAERADTVRAIEMRAARDANELDKPDVATTLQLFETNQDGLSPQEIARIYDRAYDRAKEQEDKSFEARLRETAPWLIAVLAVLGFLFRDAVKGWATAVTDAVGKRIWQRVAGSRLMRRTALKRYRRSLAEKMRDVRVIFRPNKPLDMSRVFVPLRVIGTGDDEKIDALEALALHNRVVVIGPPGAGKSILLRHIAYSYAKAGGPDGPIPVRLELHRMSDPTTVVIDELVGVLQRNDFPNARGFLERNLDNGHLLLLLDGLDEVTSVERKRVAAALRDLLERYPRASAVITCRNAVYRQEFDEVVDRTLELVEFSDQQVQAFLSSWAPVMPSSKSVEQLVLALQGNPRLMGLARNPLMLTIIAHLYTESPRYQLPNSRAEFYAESSDILLRYWHESQNQFGAGEKRAALRQLALVGQAADASDAANRRSVDVEAAVDVIQAVLGSQGKRPEDARPMLDEIVERSGLLLSVDAGERYQFAHLTFQEYFVAEKMLSQPQELSDLYRRAPDEWREIVKIWCGLADDATGMIDALWSSGGELVALEALADARSVDASTAAKVIEPFIARIRAGEADGSVERALGALAATTEGRGPQVLAALEQALDDAATPAHALTAARAIASSNVPSAARILAERYDRKEVHGPLERLGDLAVTPLLHLVMERRPEPIDGLARIGTAAAGRALTEVVWQQDADLATRAAWQLSSLLLNSEVRRALSDFGVPTRPSSNRRWIWEPFAEGPGDQLLLTAARIADLLADSPDATVPSADVRVDPRLAVPLCTVGATPLNSWEFLQAPASAELVDAATDVLGEFPRWWSTNPPRNLRNLLGGVAEPISGSPLLSSLVTTHRPAPREPRGTENAVDRFTRQLAATASMTRTQQYLFLNLPPMLRLEVAARSAGVWPKTGYASPRPADWSSHHRPVDYAFGRSWHIWVYRLIVLALVGVAAVGVAYAFGDYSTLGKIATVFAALSLLGGSIFLFMGVMNDDPVAPLEYIAAPFMIRDEPLEALATVGFLPAVGWFGTLALSGIIGLDFFGVAIVWIVAFALISALCARGGARERESANPFRGLDLSPHRLPPTLAAAPVPANGVTAERLR